MKQTATEPQRIQLTTRNLRQALDYILVDDSSFMAFCVDFFRYSVFPKLSNTMDRTAKNTALLLHAEPEQIISSLREFSPERFASFTRMIEPATEPVPPPSARSLVVATLDGSDLRALGQAILQQLPAVVQSSAAELQTTLPIAGETRVLLNRETMTDRVYTRALSNAFTLIEETEEEIAHIGRLMLDPRSMDKNWTKTKTKLEQSILEQQKIVQNTLQILIMQLAPA